MTFPGKEPSRRIPLRGGTRRRAQPLGLGAAAPTVEHARAAQSLASMGRQRAAERRIAAKVGEDAAANHLERLGYTLLARNLRVSRSEIDILALHPDGRTVVIAEVKCCSRERARPEDRIDAAKRQHLVRAALLLSLQHPFVGCVFRFDAISVVPSLSGPEVEHWPGAFDAA